MITMLLGGLWHGAAWTFVAWGAFHGAIQVVYRALHVDQLLERIRFLTPAGILIHMSSWVVTITLVMAGWILFRARSFEDATVIFSNLFGTEGYSRGTFWPVVAYAMPLLLVEIYQRMSGKLEILNTGPFLVRHTAALSIMLALVLFSAPGGQEFIYFDF
jgi:alginate O-acetyltransferase complex protein AlgI